MSHPKSCLGPSTLTCSILQAPARCLCLQLQTTALVWNSLPKTTHPCCWEKPCLDAAFRLHVENYLLHQIKLDTLDKCEDFFLTQSMKFKKKDFFLTRRALLNSFQGWLILCNATILKIKAILCSKVASLPSNQVEPEETKDFKLSDPRMHTLLWSAQAQNPSTSGVKSQFSSNLGHCCHNLSPYS